MGGQVRGRKSTIDFTYIAFVIECCWHFNIEASLDDLSMIYSWPEVKMKQHHRNMAEEDGASEGS